MIFVNAFRTRLLSLLLACICIGCSGAILAADLLDPLSLAKYVDPLPIPGVMPAAGPNYYEIGMYQKIQQLHSQLPPTTVWAYGISPEHASYPAATIEATRGLPIQVRWTNNLPMTHLLDYAIDHTLHMAHWIDGVPTVVHLHGGEVEPQSDGGPEAWFTQGYAEKGPTWSKETMTYANEQLPTTLWFHDHALGLTRLNVYAGLAGFYLLRDPQLETPLNLPSGSYEIPLAIQDKMFNTDGSLYYPVGGDNPDIHPIWQPEFFGNVILVNGKIWPYLNVEPRKYRFRILNGSNARFYSLRINYASGNPGPGFWQIGSDGGYLDAPVLIADPTDPRAQRLLMAPGERCDVVVDFSGLTPGTVLELTNNANEPFPDGDPVDAQTVGQVMQFRVVPLTGPDNSQIATPGSGYVTKLADAAVTRQMTLDEVMGPNGPIGALLNYSMWDDSVTETPTVGTTEMWRIVNTTMDAHPIHLHLVQFQLVSRQRFNTHRYSRVYMPGMEGMGPAPDITPYLIGRPRGPEPNETGWKDTYKMYPGEVTTVIIRFAPQDGSPTYDFDPTAAPGYVWHCHILEHEDNEMMRPLQLVNAPATLAKANMSETPAAFELAQNYPNPFNPTTDIKYSLPAPGHVTLTVFDILGQEVRTLIDDFRPAGSYTARWDSRSNSGREVASGIYLYRLQAGDRVETHKMTLLK